MSAISRAKKKAKAKAEAKKDPNYKRKTIKIQATLDCGCCETDPMHFFSEENAAAAFSSAWDREMARGRLGRLSSATVTDDLGKEHTHIDLFYSLRVIN